MCIKKLLVPHNLLHKEKKKEEKKEKEKKKIMC